MITVVNPEFQYKETRKPNKTKYPKNSTMNGFERNAITGWGVSGWAPSPTYTGYNGSSVTYAANDGYKPNRG